MRNTFNFFLSDKTRLMWLSIILILIITVPLLVRSNTKEGLAVASGSPSTTPVTPDIGSIAISSPTSGSVAASGSPTSGSVAADLASTLLELQASQDELTAELAFDDATDDVADIAEQTARLESIKGELSSVMGELNAIVTQLATINTNLSML